MISLSVTAERMRGQCGDEVHDRCVTLSIDYLTESLSNPDADPLHGAESCRCPNACELELTSHSEEDPISCSSSHVGVEAWCL